MIGGYQQLQLISSWNTAQYLTLYVHTSQQTLNIGITFVQWWTNVEDVGPTLYKCYTNVLCL